MDLQEYSYLNVLEHLDKYHKRKRIQQKVKTMEARNNRIKWHFISGYIYT